MNKKEYDEFMKLLGANNILIKKNLKAAIALSKIIDNHVKKVTQAKPAKRKQVVGLSLLNETIHAIMYKNLN